MLDLVNINPYIWCILVLFASSIGILIFIVKEVKFNIILLLIMVVLIPKILLICFLKKCNNILNGCIYGLILFIIYNVWLYINKTNIYIFYLNYLKIVLDNNKDKVETIRSLIIYNSNNYYN
jgi:hypothetical protein